MIRHLVQVLTWVSSELCPPIEEVVKIMKPGINLIF
jgi:hypothetical protein